MNNQTAQTMPELPGAFDVIEQVDKYNFVHNVEVYTADQMHQYARDYAASQTAGVVEGWTRDVADAAAALDKRGDRQMAARLMRLHRDMLAAAPAASGGEVWTREMIADVHKRGEELFQRINPPSAASVSERARCYHQHDAIEFAVRDLGYSPADAARITAALEQALTQQRGAASYDAGMAMHWIERYAAGIDEECQLDRIAEAFTTPQPSADAVRELAATWRKRAERKRFVGLKNEALLDEAHANELESLLSAASGEKGVG